MTMLRNQFSFASALVCGCALLVGCDGRDAAPEAEIRPVRAIMARAEAWSEFPSQVGEIRAHVESDLGFKIAGRVVERKADLGAIVRKGDVLARLNEQDQRNQLTAAQADVAAAQATLVQAAAEERRQAKVLSRGLVSQAVYDSALRARDTARAAVRAAEAKRRLAEDQLGYAVLYAPEDGAISAIGAEAGQVVAAGQMVVRLANLEKKDAVFTLAESALLRLPPDAEVEIHLLDAPQVTARGRVEQIAPNADPHLYGQVRAVIPARCHALRDERRRPGADERTEGHPPAGIGPVREGRQARGVGGRSPAGHG
jgi:RND family efflux transporter MFP subunit